MHLPKYIIMHQVFMMNALFEPRQTVYHLNAKSVTNRNRTRVSCNWHKLQATKYYSKNVYLKDKQICNSKFLSKKKGIRIFVFA